MRIYHYLSSRFALENLKRRRIKVSKFSDLNDPFELTVVNQSNGEQRKIWEEWRNLQCETWGLICFSTTWSNPIMWSHYADRHRGICLGFDAVQEVHNVNYRRERLKLDIEKLAACGKLTKEHMKKIFLTKYAGWSYEKEVRIIVQLANMIKDSNNDLLFCDFENNLKLTDVFIGSLSRVSENEVRRAFSLRTLM